VTSSLGAGLALALGSTVALNWGFFAQHGAASSLPPLSVRSPLRSLGLMFSNARWLAGFVVGLLGWALYVVALRLAPLSLVQATSAGGIGVLALLVERRKPATAKSPAAGAPRGGEAASRTATRLSRGEWAGVGAAVLGLAALGVSLAGQTTSSDHGSAVAIAAWVAVSLAAAATLPWKLPGGVGFGIAAGVLYAAGDVATKAAVGGGTAVAFVAAVLACHGLAFVALQLGFQRGGALVTAGVATLLTNALPIVAGTVVFGERLPGGGLGVLRLGAFAAVVVGAALLARLGTAADLPEVPEGARPPGSDERGEQERARERQRPGREAMHPDDQHLRRERAVNGDAEERMDGDARRVGLEAQLEHAVVGDRDRREERQPP
jgi:hypothetical protein